MPKELKREMLNALAEKDFTDPYNLIPLLIVGAVIVFIFALFADQPPE